MPLKIIYSPYFFVIRTKRGGRESTKTQSDVNKFSDTLVLDNQNSGSLSSPYEYVGNRIKKVLNTKTSSDTRPLHTAAGI